MLTKGCVLALLCVGAAAQTRPNAEGIRRDEMVNLVAAGLSANPENPVTGEQVRIFLTVVNQSENTARAVGVVLFAGKAQVATATLDIAGRHRTIVPLSWNPTAAGPWQLTTVIDPDRRLVEEDRADNVAGLDLVVTGNTLKGAAFSVSDLDLITQGDRTTIRARVQNTGTTRRRASGLSRAGCRRRYPVCHRAGTGSVHIGRSDRCAAGLSRSYQR